VVAGQSGGQQRETGRRDAARWLRLLRVMPVGRAARTLPVGGDGRGGWWPERSAVTGESARVVAAAARGWVLVVVGCLVATNLLEHRILPGAPAAVAATLVLAMVAVAWASGLTVAELGLAKQTWARGLRWAAVPAAAVLLGYGLVLVVPALEQRVAPAAGSWTGVAVRVLVVLPLLTVIPEELAFRGVTWALLRRAGGTRVATLGSSALFGLWHVLAALGGGPANETAAGALGEGAAGVAARVAGTVLVTFLAGLLLCALRAGSGSLLAPIGLHWVANGAGIVLVHLVAG
jgi:membrane protease YdiL (CAAX protease family)